MYHLLNGVRHLAWDLGFGFDVGTATLMSTVVYALSVALTVGAFALVYTGHVGYLQQ